MQTPSNQRPRALAHAVLGLAALGAIAGSPGMARAQTAQAPQAPQAPQPQPQSLPTAAGRAHLLHVPPASAAPGEPLRLAAVIDGLAAEPTVLVRHRRLGSGAPFRDAPFERSSAGGWYATIPADQVTRPGLEYFISGTTTAGTEVLHFASSTEPQPIVVEASLDARRSEADAARMGGKLDVISFDLHAHDFGNRYGTPDELVRAELAWTHNFLSTLYSISMGYGSISGKTPDREGPLARAEEHSARYGFGQVRLRLHPSVFVDGRALVGVDEEGFIRGVAGAVTLGRPWLTNLSFGGEALERLGPTGWVRLQWDTVPPFLMGASVVKTDLPGAVLVDGLYLEVDVSYTLFSRLTVRGAVSYGSRDGRAHFGGGFGAAMGF